MRFRAKAWGAAVLAPVVLLLAGCSGGSIVPGLGTDGGLGTIGTDAGNQDEAMVARVKGSPYGDFVAQGDGVRLKNPPSPAGIEAKQEYRVTATHAIRTLDVDFQTAPVQGQTFSVPKDVEITYKETPYVRQKDPQTGQYVEVLGTTKAWVAQSGSVKVTRLNADRIDAGFSAALVPDLNAAGNITLTSGVLHLKF